MIFAPLLLVLLAVPSVVGARIAPPLRAVAADAAAAAPNNRSAAEAASSPWAATAGSPLRWEPVAALLTPRHWHAAAAANGTVVVLGGQGKWNGNNYSYPVLASASRYSPGAANAWAALPTMTTPRHYFAAAALNSTTVFALGGCAQNDDTGCAIVLALSLIHI